MSGFLDRISNRHSSSADQAKQRLKFVLIHDRSNLSPGQLEQLKNDLLEVIGRYVEIEPAAVRIDVAQEGREQRLVADIPLKSTIQRRRGS